MHKFNINLIRAIDGDTYVVDIFIGLYGLVLRERKIRLWKGVDTPEIRGPEKEEGLRYKEYCEGLLTNKRLMLHTEGELDSFGRLLGDIIIGGETSLTDLLLKDGPNIQTQA